MRLNSLSRRRFGSGLIAATTLLPAARAMAGEGPPAIPSGAPPAPIGTAIDPNQHLAIEVMLDSQGPFRFVVDTGADRSVLAEDVAGALGLATGHHVLVEGIIRTIPAVTVPVRSMTFGAVERRNLDLPVLPRALLGADGYLGLDVIGEHRVTFDFDRHDLTIEESHLELSAGETQAIIDNKGTAQRSTIHAVGSYGHLKSFQCDVDGVASAAFLDSGAQVTIGNSRLARELRDRNSQLIELGTVPITGVTGGQVMGEVVSIEKIRLADISFKAKVMVIADLAVFETWSLADRPALMLGMNYLSRFSKVTIDYALRQFHFELADLERTLRA